MSLLTTIYKFIKPELTDSPPDITATNPNWDKVEAEFIRQDDARTSHEAENASEDNVHGLRENSIILGNNASNVGSGNNVILGRDSQCGNNSIAIGYGAKGSSTAYETISIGRKAIASSDNTIAIGYGATTTGGRGINIGSNISAGHNQCIIGRDTHSTQIPGNFTVSGTKNFEIPHPKPEKQATHRIRHGAVESPTAGDTLYRYKIQSTKENDKVLIDLPDYFIHLNKDVQIFVTGQGHFGNGYGELNKEIEQLEISCQFEGEYNVLVIGTRNDDHQSVQDWDIKGVEREIGESWTGETYTFSVEEIIEVEEIKEEVA